MGHIAVGIDTSKDKGKQLIGVIAGAPENMGRFVSIVDATARKHGFSGTLHWKNIKTDRLRDAITIEHSASLRECGLQAGIFPTLRFDKDKRDYYLRECPWVVGNKLAESIDDQTNVMKIVSDTDFDSLAPMPKPGSRPPTLVFLDRLVTKISTELAMTPLSAKSEKTGVYQAIRRKGAVEITVRGMPGTQQSTEVQAADMVLGMYKWARSKGKRIERVILEKTV